MTKRGGIVVTGMGAASALGAGLDAHRAAVFAGESGIRPTRRFATERLASELAATWAGWAERAQREPGPGEDLAATALAFPLHELALVAAREAWTRAGVSVAPRRVALVFGTCFGQGFSEFNPVARRVALGLDVTGPCITISTACASSTHAIGLARDLLLGGHADAVIAGGADTLLREAFAGFSALGVLSREPCAPFSEPEGTTLGEGAGFVVLERADDAARRGASAWATIAGYGLAADAHHETTPHPAGDGVARALRGALHDAGWLPRDIDFVSAHATGTANNDRIEWSVIERELGEPGRPPRVSGAKGHLGHTQGASGVLELIVALLCQREGRLPPTLHFRGARAGCPLDPLAGREPREGASSRALKLSAAFGGANAAVAYSSGDAGPLPDRPRAPVVVEGAGVVGPAGALRMTDLERLAGGPIDGRPRGVDLDSLGIDGRRLDPSSRWLTAASALALSGADAQRRMDRTGLFVAATEMPRESSRRCMDSIKRRGVEGTSATAFARMSVNAPAGACSLALGLLGPVSALSIDEGSGLLAIALAADWLSRREDVAAIVAGGVDELAPDATRGAEGAACLLLARAPRAGDASVVVSGWAIAGPGDALDAVARALHGAPSVEHVFADADASLVAAVRARVGAREVVHASALFGAAPATRTAAMAAVAAARISSGEAASALLLAARGTSSVAVVFSRRELRR